MSKDSLDWKEEPWVLVQTVTQTDLEQVSLPFQVSVSLSAK
jgi:hypothetical protein